MAFAFVQNNDNSNDASDTTVTVTLTGVVAGHLIAVWVDCDGTDTTVTLSDGGSSWVTKTHAIIGSPTAGFSTFAYTLSAVATGSVTYTATFGVARTFKRIHVWEFSYTGSASFDTENTGTGTVSGATTGNITTVGTDEVVLGGCGGYSGVGSYTFTTEQINAVTADGTRHGADATTSSWYRILTATFSGGNASVTITSPSDWSANIIAFTTTPAVVADHRPLLARFP